MLTIPTHMGDLLTDLTTMDGVHDVEAKVDDKDEVYLVVKTQLAGIRWKDVREEHDFTITQAWKDPNENTLRIIIHERDGASQQKVDRTVEYVDRLVDLGILKRSRGREIKSALGVYDD